MQNAAEKKEKIRIKRTTEKYIADRYITKSKKYQQKVNSKFNYKKDEKKPGKCPYCGKVYKDR